jgi:hypothetical protein
LEWTKSNGSILQKDRDLKEANKQEKRRGKVTLCGYLRFFKANTPATTMTTAITDAPM